MRQTPRPIVLYNPKGPGELLPLGLAHVASMFPERQVEIVDGRVELAPEARVQELVGAAACLGVSAWTGAPLLDALRVTRAARALRPDLPIVWGGWLPSLEPEQCLASGAVDACVIGQGERAFAETVAALEGGRELDGIQGLAWRRGERVVRNPARPLEDVNGLPPVDYERLDLERYFRHRGQRCLEYSSSQGCQFECSTCSSPGLYSSHWTGLAPERVVAELQAHVRRYRLTDVAFVDDSFFADPARVEAICAGLLGAGVKVRWAASCHACLFHVLSERLLRLMKESGCTSIDAEVGSGSPELLRRVRKRVRVEDVTETAERLRRVGIQARFSFLAGLPDEPAGSLADTYRTAKRLRKIDASFATPIRLYLPSPGTELERRRSASGGAGPERLEDWAEIDLGAPVLPWVPPRVGRAVSRLNFYLRLGHQGPRRGLGGRFLRRAARTRLKLNFFGLDLERRVAERLKRLAASFDPHRPGAAKE